MGRPFSASPTVGLISMWWQVGGQGAEESLLCVHVQTDTDTCPRAGKARSLPRASVPGQTHRLCSRRRGAGEEEGKQTDMGASELDGGSWRLPDLYRSLPPSFAIPQPETVHISLVMSLLPDPDTIPPPSP